MRTRSELRTACALALATAALLAAAPAAGQATLSVVTQVTGRPGNDLMALGDQVRVTLINPMPDSRDVTVLAMRLRGDNGVEISTPP